MLFLAILVATVAGSLARHTPYIIGGEDVSPVGKYPWQGSLQLLGSHSCGCSVIGRNKVLTAAHCVLLTSLQSVVLGAHDMLLQEGEPQRYGVESAQVHPSWNPTGEGFPNDVAVITLKENITFGEFVQPVALAPAEAKDDDYSMCVITGWGATNMIGGILPVLPNILQEAPVGIYGKDECQAMFEGVGNALVNDGHICVGDPERGACSGDSGGPLVCQYNGGTVQAGLTSWGVSTCDTQYPSVYTRVSYFREWIDQVLAEE